MSGLPRLVLMSAACLGLMMGCNLSSVPSGSDADANGISSDPSGGSGGASGGSTDASGDGTTLGISGRIAEPAGAKRRPRAQAADAAYTVAAQSVETMEIYSTQADPNGSFELAIPDSEQGNTFMVVLFDPQGRPVGPIVFDETGSEARTAANLKRPISLGEVAVPDDPAARPMMPGDGFDGQDLIADDVMARTDENGVPVGVPSLGKGADAMGTPADSLGQSLDRDRDGLPDFIDADNDGDGVVDDFDDDGEDAGRKEGFRLNFFMNLKIQEDSAAAYYGGTAEALESALATDTVITFEVVEEPDHTPAITAVRLLDRSAPSYVTSMTILNSGVLWSDSGYAFDDAGDRFQQFVVPHARINAGDTFMVAVELEDGTMRLCYSMINYVFTSIPRLISYGTPGAVTGYTAGGGITFDPNQDLVLEFQPPKDETGAYLTGFDYTFSIFYYDGSDQLDVDGAATWSSPPAGFDADRQVYSVAAAALGSLSADSTYTVTIPKEAFPAQVRTRDGGMISVSSYKIDITAEKNGNNAALMVTVTRE